MAKEENISEEKGNSISNKNNSKSSKNIEKEVKIDVERLEKPASAAVIKLGGYLQQKEARRLVSKVESLLVENVKHIILDMSEVKYMNSSAIGAFTSCATRLEAENGKLILLNMLTNLKLVFATLGLVKRFTSVSTMDEAIKKLS